MKDSMKIMFMVFTMVSTITVVNAQSKDGKGANLEERTAKRTAHLQEELGLDDKQTKEINAISLAYSKKTQSVRKAIRTEKEAGKEVDRTAAREQMKKIREAQTKEVKAVLTPEQITKFDVIAKEHKGKKGKKGADGKGANLEERTAKRTAHLQKELGLDDKQTKEISAISLAYAEKTQSVRKAVRADKEAGKEVEKEAIHEEMKKIREAQMTAIKAVLAPEQVTKFDAMAKERKGKKGKKSGEGKCDKK